MAYYSKIVSTLIAGALSLGVAAGASAQTTLRIGLAEDPDILDPTLARTFVGRIVFASLCDKLFDIDANLRIVPQLATEFAWGEDNKTLTIRLRPNVTFHDGERMDAEAVKFSLERHLGMQGSMRRGEVSVMQSVEVVDPLTVRIHLSAPFAPFIAQLTDRAGMIVSPKAARAAGADFGNRPVCAGPYRFVERVAQDHITVERFPQYWNASAITIDRIVFQAVPDSTVRLTNLQAGALEMIERVQPPDIAAIQRNNRLQLHVYDELGYQGITINVGNGDRARAPIGANARVREAFDLAIDRATIVQVVYNGVFIPAVQGVPPTSPYHIQSIVPPTRDLERARALLREAGVATPVVVNLIVANSPDQRQVGEVMQAMAREAGFDVRIQAMEFASSLSAAERGDFEAYLLGWSGRPDPDGNLYPFLTTGSPLNYAHYSNAEVDRLMNQARTVSNVDQRRALYEQAARITLADRPLIYIYHRKHLVAHTARLTGFVQVPDGLIRVQGIRLAGN
jgi:peptide/nickel transport system substrate-binding protein